MDDATEKNPYSVTLGGCIEAALALLGLVLVIAACVLPFVVLLMSDTPLPPRKPGLPWTYFRK